MFVRSVTNFKSACEQSDYISKVAGIVNRGGVTSPNRNKEETVQEGPVYYHSSSISTFLQGKQVSSSHHSVFTLGKTGLCCALLFFGTRSSHTPSPGLILMRKNSRGRWKSHFEEKALKGGIQVLEGTV